MMPLTRAIPESIRGGYDDALYKSTFTLLFFTLPETLNSVMHVQCDAWPTVTFPAAERQRPSGGILFDDRDTMVDTAICPESLRAPTRVIH